MRRLLKSIRLDIRNPFKNGLDNITKIENKLLKKEIQQYIGEFKLNVLNYMKLTGTSYSMTTNHFGISNIGTIANWKKKYLQGDALFNSKGRPQN